MSEDSVIWQDVPDPQPDVPFIVDEPEENEFSVVCDKEVAEYDVIEMLYLINGIWRITVEDQDDTDNPALELVIRVDRRYKVEAVRQAVRKLLENLYHTENEE